MKSALLLSILLLFSINKVSCNIFKLRHLDDGTDSVSDSEVGETTDTANATVPETDGPHYAPKSSSGLSTGGIVGIAIPCIAALVGVGALAAFMGVPGGAAPTGGFGPVLNNPVPNLPPPNYVDTSMAQLVAPQEVAPVQPVVEVPPQPVQQVVPVAQVEPPVVHNVVLPPQPQAIAQPQMVPVQQMQLVPVQQVEMVPVQHVEMVPVQQVVPQVQEIGQIGEIGEIGQIGQMQGIQGGEFLTAPEGYGTSVIQGGANNVINPMEFSANNII